MSVSGRELISYLNKPDCAEGMGLADILDLPLRIFTGGLGGGYTEILSTYVTEGDDGTKILAIDIGDSLEEEK